MNYEEPTELDRKMLKECDNMFHEKIRNNDFIIKDPEKIPFIRFRLPCYHFRHCEELYRIADIDMCNCCEYYNDKDFFCVKKSEGFLRIEKCLKE